MQAPDDIPIVPPPRRVRLRRLALRLAAVVVLVVVTSALMGLADRLIADLPQARQAPVRIGVIALALTLYIVICAIPFVPAVEIGLGLLIMQGAAVAPWVYAATVAGLMLAFAIGKLMPPRALRRLLLDLRLVRACRAVEAFRALPRDAKLAALAGRLPAGWDRRLARLRYPLIALLFNLPGNVVIGGGGGIAMAAGLSGLFSTLGMTLTVALAVAPVPLAVYLWGMTAIGG